MRCPSTRTKTEVGSTPVENWDTDEPSARGIEGLERMRLVRDDIAEPSLPLDQVLMNAPRHQDGFFLVHTPFAGEETES